jgi:hypothetical protein
MLATKGEGAKHFSIGLYDEYPNVGFMKVDPLLLFDPSCRESEVKAAGDRGDWRI